MSSPDCTPKAIHAAGFTLLELLVVIAIMAMATAGVSLSMRDTSQTALERDAQRLTVLLESARARSRASGVAVYWQPTLEGFRFEGLPANALPDKWLAEGTTVRIERAGFGTGGSAAGQVRAGAAERERVQLGPEPIIGAQTVELSSPQVPGVTGQRALTIKIATNGLSPFALQASAQVQP